MFAVKLTVFSLLLIHWQTCSAITIRTALIHHRRLPIFSDDAVDRLNEEMEQAYLPGLNAKGKDGVRKRYYKGTRKVGKKKGKRSEEEFKVGDAIVYTYDEKVFRGWIKGVLGENTWVIGPTSSSLTETIITTHESPFLLSKLQIYSFSVLQDVLIVWDEVDHYTQLIPGTVFKIENSEAWVIVAQHYSSNALKCMIDEICTNPYSSNNVRESPICVEKHFSVYDINIIDAVLSSTTQELNQIKSCFQEACGKNESISKQYSVLAAEHAQSLERINELEQVLKDYHHHHVRDSVRIRALQTVVDTQHKSLLEYESLFNTERKEKESVEEQCRKQIGTLTETQQNLSSANQKLHLQLIKNRRLANTNEILVSENSLMLKEMEIEKMKKMCTNSLEIVAGPSRRVADGCVVLAKESGSNQRPSAWLPIPLARTDSKDASMKTLEKRAKVLSKVIDVLSSSSEAGSDEDRARTLSAYFRQNPSLLLQICEEVNLKVIKEITPAEAVDLKVLLRLPMNRVRELRTFLNNLGIKIFPSETLVYSELIARNKSYDNGIEVGTALLKKTVSAEQPTDVTFVKVKSLVSAIQKSVDRTACDRSFTTDGHFMNKVWLKVGGDKGGSTTKLATQVANISDCNSPDNTELIAMFEATDSHDNLMTIFKSFTQDFIDIQKDFSVALGAADRAECEVFLFGDYEFLCKVLGHMGASASYPCLWCHVKLSALANNQGPHSPMLKDQQRQTYSPNPGWPSKRTAEDFVNDLASNRLDKRRNGDMRLNGASHHSIAYDPILPVVTDVDHIIPPSLHILLGLVVRYYKYLETVCRSLDSDSIQERDVALHEEWEKASKEAKEAEEAYLHEEDNLRGEEQLLLDFKASLNGRGAEGIVKCAMPICAIAGRDLPGTNVEWAQCVQCGRDYESGWFHNECLGLGPERAGADNFTVCPVCEGNITTEADVLRVQKERIQRAKEVVARRKRLRQTSTTNLEAIYAQIQKKQGPREAELNRVLEKELKVQKQAYHSQCFVGNHCRKILNNSDLLLNVLGPSTEKEKLGGLFCRLRSIFSFFTSRFLSDSEISDLCHQCWELGEWFPITFPEERIPPKLHMLIAHIPDCAKRWKTVGLLSEQGLESIHASLNREERTYSSVREKQQRMKLVFNQHTQRVVADKSNLKVQKRKCPLSECGGRFKLLDGIRKCQKCGSVD